MNPNPPPLKGAPIGSKPMQLTGAPVAVPGSSTPPPYTPPVQNNPSTNNPNQPPGAPDYQGSAYQQFLANQAAAQAQSRINNPNVNGLRGSQTVTYDENGVPTVTQSRTPQEQALYDRYVANQQGASDIASRIGSRLGGGIDLSGLPAMPGSYDQTRQAVIDAMMGRAMPEFERQGEQLNSDLIARGLRPGTEAYTREQDALNRKENDYRLQAETTAGNAADQALRADLARRAGAFGEQLGASNLDMNQYAALLNGSKPVDPNLPSWAQNNSVGAAPTFAATTAAGNYNADLYNAAVARENSRNQGLFGLGNSFLNSGAGQSLINGIPGWLQSIYNGLPNITDTGYLSGIDPSAYSPYLDPNSIDFDWTF